MPGSMNLHSVIARLPSAAAVRAADASLWTSPTGLRFLDGGAKLPEELARKITAY